MDDLKIAVIDKTVKESAPVVMINIENDGEQKFFDDLLINDGIENYILLGLSGYDWNRDLSPWKAEAIFKNGRDFGGGADEYLNKITGKIIPSLNLKAQYYALAGYSLAGLFALYAGYRCDDFKRIVSASGSLWYPDFLDYARSHELSSNIDCLYLSLGDKEAKTRNPIMVTVQENTEAVYELYKDKIKCILEMNEGNHFKDASYRLYKGIRYILSI